MTDREKEIIELIIENPMVSQQDIATKLGIQRSSVGVHILNLVKKGKIKGKGYIVSKSDYITVIGGACADITGFSNDKLIMMDSNPGTVRISPGGVARNICENLTRMGIETKFISAIGDDIHGKMLIDNFIESGIDYSPTIISKESPTSIYLSIMDGEGSLVSAVSQTDVIKQIDSNHIRKYAQSIKNASVIVIDTNLSEEALDAVFELAEGKKIFADTVSVKKAIKLKKHLSMIDTIKPNVIEAELLSGIKVTDEKTAVESAEILVGLGVKNVFISLGNKGFVHGNNKGTRFYRANKIEVINANGAGDAFLAGLAYGCFMDYSYEKSIDIAVNGAEITLLSKDTVSKNIKRALGGNND